MSSKLKFHQKRILTKNLRHSAKNVRHSAKNVRHGAKNVRPIEVGTDVSNSLGTVGRDERRCLSYPMTQIACVLMTTRTRHFVPVLCLLELVVAVGTRLQRDIPVD